MSGRFDGYSDLVQGAGSLVDANDLAGALALLGAHREAFPGQLGHALLWSASLHARVGDAGGAIGLLEEAWQRGIRIPERALRGSTGLALLKDEPAFEELVARFAGAGAPPASRVAELREIHRPDGKRPSRGWPVVIALHGNNSALALERARWAAAAGAGWAVELVQSAIPGWVPGFFVWDDDALAAAQIRQAIARVREDPQVDSSRVVLAGFSAGGYRAIEHVLSPAGDVRVVLGVAAWLPTQQAERLTAAADLAAVRAYLLVGELDVSGAGHALLAERITKAGGRCLLEERAGLGHVFPRDFDRTLARALAALEA
ncbi:MAG: dienelactone hydrolase family protein [Candidatus Limnocylindria bacterium]